MHSATGIRGSVGAAVTGPRGNTGATEIVGFAVLKERLEQRALMESLAPQASHRLALAAILVTQVQLVSQKHRLVQRH